MQGKRCFDRLYSICRSSIWFLALLFTVLMVGLNFFYQTSVLTAYEHVEIRSCVSESILTIAAGVLLLRFGPWVCRPLRKITCSERGLFAGCAVVYAVAALYLILNVDGVLRADANFIYQSALQLNKGDNSALGYGGYLSRYPHQLGMVTLERLLVWFSPNPKILFLSNFCLVLVTNHLLYRTADLLFQNRRINMLTILLSFGFLPQFFFILFAYGLIPALTAMTAAFYFALRYEWKQKPGDLILMLVFTALSVLLKKNFLIGAMAIGLYLLARYLRDRRWQKLMAAALLILCMILPSSWLQSCYEQQAGVELTGTPSVLWIGMGTDLDNRKRGPGWYDSSVWDIYRDCDYDTTLAAAEGKEKLLTNFEKIKNDPKTARTFFWEKTISQWCDPLYQSVWSGPMAAMNQETYTPFTKSLYGGGPVYDWVEAYAKAFSLLFWIFTFSFLAVFGRKTEGWEVFFLFFMGGAFFHTFWEAKSQYILPYVIVLIPFASSALSCLCPREVSGTGDENRKNKSTQ